MLLGEMIEQLNSNETTTTLAKKLGRSKQTIQKMLKSFGYAYSNTTKLWTHEGEDEPPLTTDVEELLGKARTPKTPRKTNSKDKEVKDMDTKQAFTEDELSTLKAMIKQFNSTGDNVEGGESLHSRIVQLEPDNRTVRKTFFLNPEQSNWLDEFAKRNRVNNSDIVELALLDFQAKYSK